MKIRVLTHQEAREDEPELTAGEVHEVPTARAKILLGVGAAEPVEAKAPSQRSEKRG